MYRVECRPARRLISKTIVFAAILASGTASAAGRSTYKEKQRVEARKHELIEYTRHYEEKMGLEPMVVDFLPTMDNDKVCGQSYFTAWVGDNGVENRPSIMYSTSEACQKFYSADKITRHETCHWRLQHAYLGFSKHKEEEEVETCMDWYKDKNSKRKVLLQILTFLILF